MPRKKSTPTTTKQKQQTMRTRKLAKDLLNLVLERH